MRALTVVMYHYVRNFEASRYPGIKGRTKSDFEAQIDFLRRNYEIITIEELVSSVRSGEELPDRAALLTFDDGYIEHYTNVFPHLHELGIQGCFFPPVATAARGELLDVNRVHFLLAVSNESILAKELDTLIAEHASHYELLSIQAYREKWSVANRFDTAETIYVKRMLQHVLPEELRNKISKLLFSKYVSIDERAFAEELYLNVEQLRLMQRSGMYVGSHGDSHYWLDRIASDQLADEIDNSLDFLRSVGSPVDDFWVMCYPFGAVSDEVKNALSKRSCAVAFTTEPAVADLSENDSLLLPRLDTNDLPARSL